MIIPAILEKNPQDFKEKLEKIAQLSGIEKIQVDFADGLFVPNQTLSVNELGQLDGQYNWEAHVMCAAATNFKDYVSAGFGTIIIHYESYASEVLLEEAIASIIAAGVIPALAISPATPVSVLRYFTDTINHFTILSVQPGMQEQSFITGTFERVAELRQIAPNATIEVDGGVNSENIARLIATGANDLAVGSALFETEDIKQNYQNLVAQLQ